MKKYFYYVVQYELNRSKDAIRYMNGVCESKEDGLFPLTQILSRSTLILKHQSLSNKDVVAVLDSIRVINTVEISKNEFLLEAYENINGKDDEK